MPAHVKHAHTNVPVLNCIAERWSPYVFEPRAVEREKLMACLEAARWAASSYNEQPWSFLVAERTNGPEFACLHGCLVEANQGWCQNVGVLVLTVYCKTFARGGKPNRAAEHDLGLAAANFSLQAVHLGLATHHMAGVELAQARAVYNIPETHEPFSMIALGYAGDPAAAANLAARDLAPRARKPLAEFVFQGQWKQPF